MIDCVSELNAHLFTDALQEMFRWRYEIFVKTRGWSALQCHDGLERDVFDRENAVYLLCRDKDQRLCGSLRLLPTSGPHLLSDVLHNLAPDGVPRGPDVFEMTRYFTIRDREQPTQMRQAAGELLCGMFEYCLMQKAEWITTAFDTFYLRRMRHNGWNEVLLGPAVSYAEGEAVAIKFAASIENLEKTRRVHGVVGPVLRLTDGGCTSAASCQH